MVSEEPLDPFIHTRSVEIPHSVWHLDTSYCTEKKKSPALLAPSIPYTLNAHFFAAGFAGADAGGAFVASVGGAADFLPWRLMRSKR